MKMEEVQDWLALKSFLIQEGSLDNVFRKSIDESVRERLANSGSPGRDATVSESLQQLGHDPLLVDVLLNKISELVDRILAYRREARELEVAAVKAGADYQLFLAQSKAELALELSQLRGGENGVKAQARVDHESAAKEFGSESSLNRGLKRISEGQVNQLAIELKICNTDAELIRSKWKARQEFQEAYQARHSEDGNAHHYAQRAERLMLLISEDCVDAYTRAEAAAVGIEMVLGRKPSALPSPKDVHFIDDFVLWCRKEIREFNRDLEDEVQYDLVIPLVQPILSEGRSIVSAERFNERLATSSDRTPFRLEFSVPKEMFFGDKNVRLIAVGLSYGNRHNFGDVTGADRDLPRDAFAQVRGSLHVPKQQLPDGKLYAKPPLRFGNITAYTGQTPSAMASGPEVLNVNPIGEWVVVLETRMAYKDIKAYLLQSGINSNPMLDLKVHMKVRARPSPSSF